MTTLDNRFDEEIEKRKFNFFEMSGFMQQPKLAIKAGVAIGYQMALNDIASEQARPSRAAKRGGYPADFWINNHVMQCPVCGYYELPPPA